MQKNKKKKNIQKNQVNELPLEIIANILLLLSTKSIVRSKIICKQWKELISDLWFIEEHSKNSKQNPKFLFITTTTTTTDVKNKKISCTFNFSTMDDEGRIKQKFTKKVNRSGSKPYSVFRVAGYNDLVCFRALWARVNIYGLKETIYICNPTTKKVLSLPKRSQSLGQYSRIGFGYSVYSNEYKVARIFFPQQDIYGIKKYRASCEILSLGTYSNNSSSIRVISDGWKVIEQKCPYLPDSDTSIFINDCFNWTSFSNKKLKCFILILDMKNYKFSIRSKPESVEEEVWKLLEIEGKLGICGFNVRKGIIKVYKVEEYYGNLIWNEVEKIDLNIHEIYRKYPESFYWPPRCMVKKGELTFFPTRNGRVTFNFQTREFIWYKPYEDDGLETAYYETL